MSTQPPPSGFTHPSSIIHNGTVLAEIKNCSSSLYTHNNYQDTHSLVSKTSPNNFFASSQSSLSPSNSLRSPFHHNNNYNNHQPDTVLEKIRLKSVVKNASLSSVLERKGLKNLSTGVNDRKKKRNDCEVEGGQQHYYEEEVNFDYFLFVFCSQHDRTPLKSYLSQLKTSSHLYHTNITFITCIQEFLSTFPTLHSTLCHKRYSLLIGQHGIVNHKHHFTQIHEIHILLDSKEKYSNLSYLMKERNVKSIVWDFGKVEGLLVGMGMVKGGGVGRGDWRDRKVDEYSNGTLLVVDDKENINKDFMNTTKCKNQQGTNNIKKVQKPQSPTCQLPYYSTLEDNQERKHQFTPISNTSNPKTHQQPQQQPPTILLNSRQLTDFPSTLHPSNEYQQTTLSQQTSDHHSQLRLIALSQLKQDQPTTFHLASTKRGKSKSSSNWFKRFSGSSSSNNSFKGGDDNNPYLQKDQVIEKSSHDDYYGMEEKCASTDHSNATGFYQKQKNDQKRKDQRHKESIRKKIATLRHCNAQSVKMKIDLASQANYGYSETSV